MVELGAWVRTASAPQGVARRQDITQPPQPDNGAIVFRSPDSAKARSSIPSAVQGTRTRRLQKMNRDSVRVVFASSIDVVKSANWMQQR